jgi:hypothetical protein
MTRDRKKSRRPRTVRLAWASVSAGVVSAVAACLVSCSGTPTATPSDGGNGKCYGPKVSGMGVLQDFTPPCDPGPRGILLTASGEVLALGGYDFPPSSPGDLPFFVDGWEIRYTRVLITFGHVTLNSDPDLVPTDQSQMGAVVAEADGPWAVDLHKGGPIPGKGGGDEQAAPILAIPNANMAGGVPFDPTLRYAFSDEVVPATAQAQNVNLDGADLTDYQDMIAKGYTLLLVGTATFKGTGCTTTDPTYDFSAFPAVVDFHFGFKAPTSYLNMQNPDNDPAPAFPGEEHQRGVHVLGNQSVIAQATFHLDHAFWESFLHDSPAHFDQFAARNVGMPSPVSATLEDQIGRPFEPFLDGAGHTFPWRSCVAAQFYQPPNQSRSMGFETYGVPVNLDPTADPNIFIRDYYDFTTYNLSTFGHLNSDGLAFVQRHYPSPP